MKEFKTILKMEEAEIVEKKSKFIAHLIKVENKKQAEEIIKEYKKKYYNARHNCVAYRVIENEIIFEKASDDGEPSGTAGGPMLNILQKNNLANVMIIVTRYFGGILLGTGGLVRAYSEATLQTIKKAEIIELEQAEEAKVEIEYNFLESFKYYCKTKEILITNTEYREDIVCKILIKESKKEDILEDFKTKKVNLKDLKWLSKKYIEKSIRK